MARLVLLLSPSGVALLVVACTRGAGSRAAGSRAESTEPRPNIVIFLVDDLGWQDVQLALADKPTPFNARYRTPNLLRLAARGMTFTNAYAAAPVCTPSCVAHITGR